MKTAERDEARRLRRDEGLSIREITRKLNVSKSSVSLWVRDVPLTPEQRERLRAQNPRYGAQNRGAATNALRARHARTRWHEDGRAMAQSCGPEFSAGCMLYWAEGSKTRNAAQLSNSDPEVVRFFVNFLRRYFEVEDQDVRVTCNLFADHVADQERIERFWLSLLLLPPECLRKSVVNVYSKYSQKKRCNMLPYGTCRISVHRTQIVQTIYGAIQEYGGFERPEWLD